MLNIALHLLKIAMLYMEIVSYFNIVTYTIKIGEYTDEFENFVVYVHPLDTSLNPNESMVKLSLPSNLSVDFNPKSHKEKIENIINGSNPIMNKLGEKLSRFETNRQNEILRNQIRSLNSENELLDFWIKNQQHIYNSILFIIRYSSNSNGFNFIQSYLNMLINEKSIISDDIKLNIKQSNNQDLFKPFMESLDLSLFMNRVCMNLAKKYNKELVIGNRDILLDIEKEILFLAERNIKIISPKGFKQFINNI